MPTPNGRRVAVTGIGFMTPVGCDAKTVWSNLIEGASGVGPITLFDARDLPTRIAAEVHDFVPEDYMDDKSARNASRYCQFAVAAARGALRDANLDPSQMDTDDVGVIVSSAYGGVLDVEAAHIVLREGAGVERISPFAAAMMAGNMAPAFVAMNVHAGGINYSIGSACASSANAIGEAGEIIRRGDAKVMLAGGAEACITPLMVAMFNRINATSVRNDEPERASRPFDRDRDGFVWAEGSVILALEDWDHAQARGQRILAELAGYGSSTDMFHFTSPDPEGSGAARAMRKAMAKAGVRPEHVDYVNAHGTSTRLGDVSEVKAIKLALGPHANAVAISSTKSVHGHLMGAAGAIEAAISVLAIQHGTIPPTINLDNQDPELDIDCVPNNPRKADIRVAVSNSFGFGGHDASLVFRKVETNGFAPKPDR